MLVADDGGQVVGFGACQACEDALHLWELAVRHERQGEGVGHAIVAASAELARLRGLPAVTLSTFRDIAWNAPFYARLGFVEIKEAARNPRLTLIRQREADLGLDVANRCTMRLALQRRGGA